MKISIQAVPQAFRNNLLASGAAGLLMWALAATVLPGAEEPPLPGHSIHGEAFNDGPRQKAGLLGGTGGVHLTVSTSSPEAQKFFDQGLGQLHGFWYFEAERSFRQVALLDPDCAMAYWGMAQANLKNEKRARGFIAEAVKRIGGVSGPERLYIEAAAAFFGETDRKKDKDRTLALMAAFERIIAQYPQDIEAMAFLAFQKWEYRRKIPLNDAGYQATDELIGRILAVNPMHPAHHYRIHLWDDKDAARALESAARCGPSAPAIAHMWHMPGHTYSKLRRYADAAWQQEASARVDHAHMMRDRVMPDQIHNYAHNNEWLCRNLMHTGRATEALDLAMNMVELPRHPAYNTLKKGSSQYGRKRLVEVLTRFEMWEKLLELSETPYLAPTDDEKEQVVRLHARGLALGHLGRLEEIAPIVTDLELSLADLTLRQTRAGEEAAEKARSGAAGSTKKEEPAAEVEDEKSRPDDEEPGQKDKEPAKDTANDKPPTDPVDRARWNARKTFDDRVRAVTESRQELLALHALKEGRTEEAMDGLKRCRDVPRWRMALYQLEAGRHEEAERLARELVKADDRQVVPVAVLVKVLHQAGRSEDARAQFDRLRKLAGQADLSTPPLARLAPLAQTWGLPTDWRQPEPAAADTGDRPVLDTLGPFRWSPVPAASWTLPDSNRRPRSLSDYRGRPLLAIFYLGHGCVHCTEQLAAFAPLTPAFREAGIELVGISTDTIEDLDLALKPARAEGGFPFPLLADPSFAAFKHYRAFDDFENKPLHGTFLIDAQGLIRWQDIGFNPFMDGRFLLEESRRLLALPPLKR